MDTRRTILIDPPTNPDQRRIYVQPNRHFAVVTLDRDEWHHQQTQRGINADTPREFLDAVHRCNDAAADHLWVNGYAGGFSGGAGNTYIDLYTPYPFIDDAMEALRTAEVDRNYQPLEALAGKLTPPLDEWLAPGERILRRGVDFHCSPARFLHNLRALASRRGLRLNGRVCQING